jgi:hypothetical protein
MGRAHLEAIALADDAFRQRDELDFEAVQQPIEVLRGNANGGFRHHGAKGKALSNEPMEFTPAGLDVADP